MKRIGYTAPRIVMNPGAPRFGGFVILVYGSANEPYLASGQLRIEEFLRADLASPFVRELPAGLQCDVAVGSPFEYGFESRGGTLAAGAYEGMAERVRCEFGQFDDLPFTQIDLAGFLDDGVLHDQAMGRCVDLMNAERPGSGDRFRANNPFRPKEAH